MPEQVTLIILPIHIRMESTQMMKLKRVEGHHTITRSAGDVMEQHCMEVGNDLLCSNQIKLLLYLGITVEGSEGTRKLFTELNKV